MRNWERIFAIIISAIVLGACNTISDKAVSTPSSFVNVGTFTTTAEPVRTPSTTNTTTPKVMPSPTLPAQTSVALATMEMLVANEPDLAKYNTRDCMIYPCYASGSGLSPNGNWAVFFNGNGLSGLSVVKIDGSKRWDIDYLDIASCPCGPSVGVYVEHWSKDGKYLYVSPNVGGDDIFDNFWRSLTRLIRVSLDEGIWVDTNMGSAFSFSPDDSSIAYRKDQKIIIYEFRTGQSVEFDVPHNYDTFGQIVWSPDKKKISFVASSEGMDPSNGFTLLILNLVNKKIELILEDDERYLYPAAWQTENIILLQSWFDVDYGYADLRDGGYQLNLQTNEITKWVSP